MTETVLDGIAGIGPVRRKRLLRAFGSIAGLQRASLGEIAAVKGMTPSQAAAVKAALGGSA